MVTGLDRKQRDDFDSTLNSGVSSSSWAQIESRAFDRLAAGEFDRSDNPGNPDGGE